MPKKFRSSSANASLARLRKVQGLLKDSKNDCLLCIQGIDSRYNEGMQECSDYLLLGLFESYRQDLLSTGSDDDIIDDLILCVKTDSVDVFCNPINYPHLLPYIAAWPNLHIYCLSESQFQIEDDFAEEFKVKCFVSMISKCKHVAVPFYSKNHLGSADFDKMKVEQWPLIQAYALEDYGRGTFFTLVHDVADISSRIAQLSARFDDVSTECLITEHLPIFERQWEGLGKTVDVARMNNFSEGFTEMNVIEPLATYYKHGTVGMEKEYEQASLWLKPFCYMGTHTSKVAHDVSGTSAVADITTAGLDSSTALHMVCHGVSPRSGLSCTRTYFFDSSSLPPSLGSSEEYRSADTEQLSRAYKTAIEVVLKSINSYSASLQARQVIDNAKQAIVSSLQKFMDCRKLEIVVELKPKLADESLRCDLAAGTVMVMSVVINNIHSSTDRSKILGAVAYSDSFILSTIWLENSGIDSEVLVLTENVPRWETWNLSRECAIFTSHIDRLLGNSCSGDIQRLGGELLIDGQSVEIISPHIWMQPISCSLYLYRDAVVLTNNSVGPITMSKEDLKSAQFYDGGGPSVPAFVILYTSMDLQTKLPIQLHNTTRMLVISLSPRTKAYKQFFEQVFEAWKLQEGSSFALTMEETLPENLNYVHEKVATRFKSQIARPLSTLSTRSSAHEEPHLHNYDRFLSHISVSAGLEAKQRFDGKDIPMLLGTVPTEEVESDSEDIMLTISIVSGLPGSYKENVANFITKLTQERSRWVIHKQTPETSHVFDSSKLESSLSYVYNVLKKKSNAATKSSRMLVITPGFTDIETVVGAIKNHPNKDLLQHVRIGAITTCVDPLNSFISGYYTMPGLLNQCAHGWVNNIVLTNTSNHGERELSRIQNLIRAVNPSVNFILADRGELTRSQDIELMLSDSAFEQHSLTRARLLCQSDPKSSCEAYGMNTVVLKFNQPLVKQALISKLKDVHKSISGNPAIITTDMKGYILHVSGRTEFVGMADVFDVTYSTISNISKISPVQLKANEKEPQRFMSFVGFALDKDILKGLLRGCVPPKPQKKTLLSVQSLDRSTKAAIHKEKHLQPLPPGWFYNGGQYVDMSGERTDRHPEFDRFLQEYVDKMNAEMEVYNKQLDSVDYHDLFE